MNMRTILQWALLCCCIIAFRVNALDLELNHGTVAKLPIAILSFGEKPKSSEGVLLQDVIKSDFQNSGQFEIYSTPHALKGIRYIIKGGIVKTASGQLEVSVSLLNPTARKKVVLSEHYLINPQLILPLAHHISDIFYQKITGQKGIFSTRLAYIVKEKRGNKMQYRLEISDIDGRAPKELLLSTQPILSPSWSHDGKKIAYVSFENRQPEIFIINVSTGSRFRLTSFQGLNGAPTWSPDDKTMAFVLSKDGTPNLYLMNIATRELTQLTHSSAIDTEPQFSKDGKYLLFTSNRGGSPQIYKVSLKSKRVSRITYDGRYNARARETNNAYIMMHKEDKRFIIGVLPKGRSEIVPLTYGKNDESPSLSPNGKWIVFSTHIKGKRQLKVVSIDGKHRRLLPQSYTGAIQEPAWSPYLT